MQYLLTTIILCFSLVGYGQEPATIKVAIKKFANNQGTIRAELYSSADKWLEEPFMNVDTTIYSTNQVILYFTNVPKGTYAIAIYHDENDNGDLDTYASVIPKEDYGFSNNAAGQYGPASFSDASFTVTDTEITQVINLN